MNSEGKERLENTDQQSGTKEWERLECALFMNFNYWKANTRQAGWQVPENPGVNPGGCLSTLNC